MSRIDQTGDDVADRAETDADALEAIEREERMLERTWGAPRKVAASVLRGVADTFRAGTPPAGTPVGSNRVTQDTPSVTSLVEWIVKRNLVKEARARLSHMSQDQVLAALESLRTYPDQTLNRAGGDPGFTPEMAQLHMVLVGVKGDEERAEAKLARRAENKRLVEKARELLGLAISLDTALDTEASRKLFNTARVILMNLEVAP